MFQWCACFPMGPVPGLQWGEGVSVFPSSGDLDKQNSVAAEPFRKGFNIMTFPNSRLLALGFAKYFVDYITKDRNAICFLISK